jgi:hypothetical protein
MEESKRRTFLKIIPIVAASALGARAGLSFAQAKKDEKKADGKKGDAKGGELPHLAENDPQAQALGYKHDAKQVDRKKFANYQPGQLCSNCQQFQAKGKEQWAPCAIFPGKSVNANGWCSAWVKKA